LHQRRGLLPVDMLVNDVVAAKMDHRDVRKLHVLTGGRNSGQHEIDFDVVGSAKDKLVHERVGADRARYRDDLGVLRDLRNEMVLVEPVQFAIPVPAGHVRHVIHVRLGDQSSSSYRPRCA
jgi:hypothetical protein